MLPLASSLALSDASIGRRAFAVEFVAITPGQEAQTERGIVAERVSRAGDGGGFVLSRTVEASSSEGRPGVSPSYAFGTSASARVDARVRGRSSLDGTVPLFDPELPGELEPSGETAYLGRFLNAPARCRVVGRETFGGRAAVRIAFEAPPEQAYRLTNSFALMDAADARPLAIHLDLTAKTFTGKGGIDEETRFVVRVRRSGFPFSQPGSAPGSAPGRE